MSGELLLVGSIPLDTPEDVFRTFGKPLGKHLFAMPDGEVGPRRHWISRVHYQVLAAHPELEVVQHPAPDENGVERQHPRNAADAWWFRVRDGFDRVRFGDPGWRLGYARDAINSYFVFRTMKEKGVLPSHLRFQVSIPMVNSVLPPRIFPNQKDIEKVRPGYEAATRAEIAKIVEKIPPNELAIQWDCSTEIQDAYGAIAGYPLEGAIERNLIEVRNLSPHIPREVALGYHFCFGTLGGWPRFAPDDLGQAVKLANAFVAASGRPVDWIHIPCSTAATTCSTCRCASLSREAPASIWAPFTTCRALRSGSQRCESICLNSGSPPIAVSAGNPFPSCPISSMTICGPPRSPRSDPAGFFNPGLLRCGILILPFVFLARSGHHSFTVAMSALPPKADSCTATK